jgi:hypothetical protein
MTITKNYSRQQIYLKVVINHYSRWCEAKAIHDHIVEMVARFLQEDIIYWYGVPKSIMIDNDGEWPTKSHNLRKFYGIQH